MGWIYTEKDSSMSVKEFFEMEFGGQYTRVLDCAVVGLRTAYVAVESTAAATREPTVGAVVCHLDYAPNERFNFGYKDVSEEMGPVEDECPERILDMLSETTYEYALSWRERCRARTQRRKAQPPLKTGSYLRMESPVEFADGRWRETFYIEDAKRRSFISDDGRRCKIPRSVLEERGYNVHDHGPGTAALCQ